VDLEKTTEDSLDSPWNQRIHTRRTYIQVRLSTKIKQLILKYFEHVHRRKDDKLEKLMVQGKVEGTRPRGRSPKRWLNLVKQFTGKSFQDSIRGERNGGKLLKTQHETKIGSRRFKHEASD